VHFNIPAQIPLGKAISYTSVAQTAKVPEHQLRQIARMAMTNGLFREPSPNMLSHTPLSARLATNSVYLETTLFQAETTASIAVKMTEMTCKYGGSERLNETAHNIAMETDLPFFPYLGKNPKIAARLQAAMKFLGGAEETHTVHLIEMFNWAGLGEAEVVDVSEKSRGVYAERPNTCGICQALTNSLQVGGSTGHISIALARAFPKLTFTVQDLPHVISKAAPSPLVSEVKDRIRFTSHDFFQLQPPASLLASVFLLRLVVQNHPKTAAQKILRNIASVMKPSALILLNNHILPKPGTAGLRDESRDRSRSLFMMQAMNGGDRDEEEFRELVEGVGAGLRVQEVVKRNGSALGLIVIKKL
jgi:6-hydroxytryprostatin B O-methyltransferase